MNGEDCCRQVSILSLIAQAHPSEFDNIRRDIENGRLGLDENFKILALNLLKKRSEEKKK